MKEISNFYEANEYLKSLYVNNKAVYNLDSIKQVVNFLNNPQNKLRVVHVAGTSGKTSTSYFMAALLVSAGQKTGLTVSPIIDEVNERLQINLEPLAEGNFIQAFNEFINLLSKSNTKSSRFEFLIAFAYWYFVNQAVDYAVIEVGLGGLQDATNVITSRNKICLITDIGYDHVNVLGNTLSEIATHKAGIILPGNEVFMHPQTEEVMKVVETRVKQTGANLHLVSATPNLEPGLPDYQHRNWELAYAAYKFIQKRDGLPKLKPEELNNTKHVQVPGRMDIKHFKDKTIILDGAHNAQKMTAFISSFKKLYPNTKPAILIAMRNNKDYKEVASQLSPLTSRVITTTFKSYQDTPSISLGADELAAAFNVSSVLSISDPKTALSELLNSKQQILVITGSLYLLSQLRQSSDFLK